jgi:LysR family glycine cleavage system transcriptional activator
MSRRLPPLNSLRAFEAAARHLSFTRAAEELFVTQAAISHQVKALEDHLGIKLFRRLNRALRLTEEGQDYLPAVRRAFDLLHEATQRLVDTDSQGTLTVTVLPSFAARWLVPRLGKFIRAYPEIDVRLAPSAELIDFARDNVDTGIRYGRGRYPGLRVDRLMTEDIFPVCSPALLKGSHPLQKPCDLKHHTLLHDDGHGDWRTWLMAACVQGVDPQRGPVFTDSGLLIQAATAGQGVALARGALAGDDLTAGRLVRPFEFSSPSEYAYYLVCPESMADKPKIAAFRQWILLEIAEELQGKVTIGTPSQPPKGEEVY